MPQFPRRGRAQPFRPARRKWAPSAGHEKISAVTTRASKIKMTQASAIGKTTALGRDCRWLFEYWDVNDPGTIMSSAIGETTGNNIAHEAVLNNLKQNTKYAYVMKIFEFSGTEVALGEIKFFKTMQVLVAGFHNRREPEKTYTLVRHPKTNHLIARWAQDDPNAAFNIGGLQFGDEIPGGYKDLSGTLARNPRSTWFDIEEYNKIEVQASGRQILWQGYLDKSGDVSGDYISMNPTALGPQSILNDNKVKVGWMNSDMQTWQAESAARAVQHASFQVASVEPGFADAASTSRPGIVIRFNSLTKQTGITVVGESWFDGEGIGIIGIIIGLRSNGAFDANFPTSPYLANSDTAAEAYNGGMDFHNESNESENYLTNGGKAYKFALLQSLYSGPFTGAMTNVHVWLNPQIIGEDATGMQFKGTAPNRGFWAQQMLVQLINKYASPLTASVSSVEDDEFVIPQAWYPQEQAVADIAKDLMKYSAEFDWFIYDDMEFQRRKVGTYGNKWKCDIHASELNETGLDSQRLWRTISVQWTDVNGRTYTAGPPGSRADVTSAALEVTDPDHPAVRAERTRHDVLIISGTANPAEAIALGQRFLEEANRLSRSGSATLSEYIMDSSGVLWPSSRVKSGDLVSFYNADDKSYRKIVNKGYTDETKSSEIDLDAPPGGLEALLERLQVGLASRGVF